MLLNPHRRMMTIDGLNAVSIMHAGRLGALAYKDKVLGYGPIAYWMLAEAVGATAIDQINSPLQDGTHVGVTLGQPGIGDGETCPFYDGANDHTDIWSATLAGAFNGSAGTLALWLKLSGAGVWTDGAARMGMIVRVDASNQVYVIKMTANNLFRFKFQGSGGGAPAQWDLGGQSWTAWTHIAMTWDNGAPDIVYAYIDGIQQGAGKVCPTWVGAPIEDMTNVGATTEAPTQVWDGYVAHPALWDTPLTPAEIADLATI